MLLGSFHYPLLQITTDYIRKCENIRQNLMQYAIILKYDRPVSGLKLRYRKNTELFSSKYRKNIEKYRKMMENTQNENRIKSAVIIIQLFKLQRTISV